MSEKIPNKESDHSQKRELVRLNKEVVSGLTFEQRLDTRERLQTHLNRAKIVLDDMREILNTFDLDRLLYKNSADFQMAIVERFKDSSELLKEVLHEIKNSKVGLSESEVNLILSYEKLYYEYNHIMTEKLSKGFVGKMEEISKTRTGVLPEARTKHIPNSK